MSVRLSRSIAERFWDRFEMENSILFVYSMGRPEKKLLQTLSTNLKNKMVPG